MTRSKTVAGITYFLGESALENHQLLKQAQKNHWWFHLNDCESGHCIINTRNINPNIITIAGNYIKKYSKLKKDNMVNICYTQVENINILDKPGMVEFYNENKVELFECYSTKIYHRSTYEGGNASEYIVPGGDVFITNHGIGSGIYGLTKKSNTKDEYTFTLENPFILSNNNYCDDYIRASLYLNERMNNFTVNSIKYTASEFVKIFPQFDEDFVFKKLKEFKADYKNRKDMVMMPINYILMGYNYDGIYSRNTIMDNYNKGNIKFTNYPTKKNILPIKYFKKRNGVNEYVIKY